MGGIGGWMLFVPNIHNDVPDEVLGWESEVRGSDSSLPPTSWDSWRAPSPLKISAASSVKRGCWTSWLF